MFRSVLFAPTNNKDASGNKNNTHGATENAYRILEEDSDGLRAMKQYKANLRSNTRP